MGSLLHSTLIKGLTANSRQLQAVRFLTGEKTSVKNGLATITMSSPKTRNALSLSMIAELQTEISRAHHDHEVSLKFKNNLKILTPWYII